MQFKIKNTNYKISFSFLALILMVIGVKKNEIIALFLIFAIAHEFVHLIFIYKFSLPPKEVSLTVFGANIRRDIKSVIDLNSEIIINISAPVFNLLTGAIFNILSAMVTSYKQILLQISAVNLTLGLFNLIPFHTFDGGNVIKNLMLKNFSEERTETILTNISIFITVVFSLISIYIFVCYQHNFSLLIMCIYMIISIIYKK